MSYSSERRQLKAAPAKSGRPGDGRPSIIDQRPSAAAQLRRKQQIDNLAPPHPISQLITDEEIEGALPAQRMEDEDETLQGKFTDSSPAQLVETQQSQPNNTGLPDNLKAGIENLSGMSMDHVKVHYNSGEPAQLNAHAYAQGNDIHVAPGQERHLPHEAWHVVQQAQGRVKPTMQMKGGETVNDDATLEAEADLMGEVAAREVAQTKIGAEHSSVRGHDSRAGSSAFFPQRPTGSGQSMTPLQMVIGDVGPIQRLRHQPLPVNEYGMNQSAAAYSRRLELNLGPNLNIATFHFVPRPQLTDQAQEPLIPFSKTETSTGVGDYVVASQKTQAERKINTSHSEHQFINDGLKNLMGSEEWPTKYVIDWIYTERPACPDIWYGQKFIANGCNTELGKIEVLQQERRWDGTTVDPYGLRNDLDITVYSSFSESATDGIKNAVKFAPVRIEALAKLKHALIVLYQKSYARNSSEDYDLMEYEEDIPARAYGVANDALSSWEDFVDGISVAEYANELRQEAEACLKDQS